jgi:uncharacterized protein (DUF58 family)
VIVARRGILLLLLAAPLLAAGTWVPALEWVGLGYLGLCLGLFLLDWRLAESVSRFEVARLHDSKLSLGAENAVRLTVRNRRERGTTLQVRDEPPDAFLADRLLHEGTVGPRDTWAAVYHVTPPRRGDYRFGQITLRWLGPLGLVRRQGAVREIGTEDGVIKGEAPVKVYPNLLNVRRYDLLLRQNRLRELGLRHTRLVGEGTEFERLREYLPDDDFRHINWKATARRNRPVTTEYQTERSQTILALIDTGRMMQSPVEHIAKLDYVINAALFLGYVAAGVGDKVGVMTFADDVQRFLSPRQGRGQFYRMLEFLYAVEPQPVEPNYERAFNYLAVKQRKRALVLIFTDLSGGGSMQQLLAHVSLLARRSLPLVVTISDPDVVAASRARPENSQAVYRQAAAQTLLRERRVILDRLERQGVLTLDVPANQLSIAVINRYLELKTRRRL